ncbi:MAG: PIG-L deacetylase family protein [Candidatus Thorarchaeota archaeon]
MKIIIFEPHPDDLLFGPGPIILNWISQMMHEIHVITVTDGRACYRSSGNSYTQDISKLNENEIAEMRINEAKQAIKFLGLSPQNHHLFHFHDTEGQTYVKEGIKKTIPIIFDADRIVLPSKNNKHIDHQATHDIAIGAAKELQLKNIEYFVYFIPSYGNFKEDSKLNQFKYNISDTDAEVLQKWLEIYQSQAKIKWTWKMYTRFLKKIRSWTYGVYKYDEIDRYYNF